ncbi:hypothetical protein ACQPYH_10370 [Kribbella sp. CA-245084]|uniref:hypothetical protein n=1 Tax=Kribbella sp. CA-245084 TaxID=3239940 RepID=UPI003D93E383
MGILDRTVTTIFALLGGVALVGFAADLSTVVAPDNVRELHAYQTAPRCPVAPSAPAECRWTEEFTVSDVRVVPESKTGDRSAVLTSASGVRWTTGYGHSGPVLEQLADGDRVTGTIWRGRLTEIAADGAAQETSRAPVNGGAPDMLALVLASSGLVTIVVCGWRLRRRRATPAMESTLGVAIGLLVLGLFSAVVLFVLADFLPWDVADNFWLFAVIFLTGAAGIAVWERRSKAPPSLPGIPI